MIDALAPTCPHASPFQLPTANRNPFTPFWPPQMTKGVQHPTRGLFLRAFLCQRSRGLLQDGAARCAGRAACRVAVGPSSPPSHHNLHHCGLLRLYLVLAS